MRLSLAKNTDEKFSIFGSIKLAIESKNLGDIAKLQTRMNKNMIELIGLYRDYNENQI